jgi:hypothetical protein
MSYSGTIKQILSDKGYDRFKNIADSVGKLLAFNDDLASERAKVLANPELNETGRSRRLREVAEKFAPTLGKLQREVEHERQKLGKAQSDLMPKLPQLSEPMLIALAGRLAAMNHGQRAEMLGADDCDPRLLAAVFQAPAVLHGCDGGLVAAIRNKIIERTRAPELAELDAKSDALTLADGAVRTARGAVIAASGEPSALLAERWLAPLLAPSAADAKSEAAVASRRDAVEIAELARGLDFDARLKLQGDLNDQQQIDLDRRTAAARQAA